MYIYFFSLSLSYGYMDDAVIVIFALYVCLSAAVQFEGVDKCRMSPTKEGKSRPPQRHSSGCLVNTKMSSMEHCGTLGERIDPTMPLESQL